MLVGARPGCIKKSASLPCLARLGPRIVKRHDATSIETILGLARLDELAGRDALAEKALLFAVATDTDAARSTDELGQHYARQNWDKALPLLRRAVDNAPRNETIAFHYAIALANSGSMADAFPMLVNSVGFAAAHYDIALAHYDRGELVACEEHLRAAIAEKPQFDQARFWLNAVRTERQKR